MTINYAEIGITTNFSFLRGGSHPQAYVHQAAILGLPAIGIADHNTLAGAGLQRTRKSRDQAQAKTSDRIADRFHRRHAGHSGLSARPRRLRPAMSAADPRKARRGDP